MSDNRKENDKKNNENDPYDFFKLTTDEKDEKNGSPKKNSHFPFWGILLIGIFILGIINNRPHITGREITAEFETEIADFWRASHSQIYPELKRMVNDDWIAASTSQENAKERYYQITSEGQEF